MPVQLTTLPRSYSKNDSCPIAHSKSWPEDVDVSLVEEIVEYIVGVHRAVALLLTAEYQVCEDGDIVWRTV